MAAQVLLADDDLSILQTLSAILRSEGAAVTVAQCARDAVQELRTKDFDLVITDMRMESPTAGTEVIRAAASQPARPIIVLLTAFPLPRADVRQDGECNVILKGSEPLGILRELRALLATVSARR
jgi:CheY-like chemotaxis protein